MRFRPLHAISIALALVSLASCHSSLSLSRPTPPGQKRKNTDVAAGGDTTCAVRDGLAYCWGRNDYGQLGDGTTVYRAQPVTVQGLKDAVQLAVGGDHTCALLAN